MRMLVVGAGSTGGYFGGRLASAERDVTFLVRPARAQRLGAEGLSIVSPHGDLHLTPKTVTAGELREPFDIVLLTVKAFSLEAALQDLAPAVGPQTMILPVLNGMRHMETLSQRFTSQNVVGCACKVAATLDDAGRIVQLATFQELAYGELDGSETPRMRALDAFLQGAGFTARLTKSIAREMWEKWTLLATLGGTTCLMRGTVGEILSAPHGRAFLLAFLDEVVAVVKAVGEAPSAGFIQDARAMMTAEGSPLTSSMYRDLIKGLPIESEQIIGDLVRRAEKAAAPAPLLACAHTHLSVYQGQREGRLAG